MAQKSAKGHLCYRSKGSVIEPVRKIYFLLPSLILLLLLSNVANATIHHEIKEGETLYSIARRYSVSVKEIKRVNRLDGTTIHPGDVLTIPTKSVAGKKAARKDKNVSKTNLSTHIVKKGENLYRISLKFGIPVEEIKRINDLSNNSIKVGQVLLVPDRRIEEELSNTTDSMEDPSFSTEIGGLDVKGEGGEFASQTNGTIGAQNGDPVQGVKKETNWLSLIDIAMDYIGVPYKFGGSSLSGIDCSAFVQMVYRYFSIDLPRTAREQFKAGVKVSKRELRIGDLIFFKTYAQYPSHVGIYIGEGKMIHASSRDKKVTVTSIDEPYYARRYIGAVRIPEIPIGIPSGDIADSIKTYN